MAVVRTRAHVRKRRPVSRRPERRPALARTAAFIDRLPWVLGAAVLATGALWFSRELILSAVSWGLAQVGFIPPVLLAGGALAYWRLAGRDLPRVVRFRQALAAEVFTLGFAVLLGGIYPSGVRLAGVDFGRVSLGGHLGAVLFGPNVFVGAVRLGLLGGFGVVLLHPRATFRTGRTLVRVGVRAAWQAPRVLIRRPRTTVPVVAAPPIDPAPVIERVRTAVVSAAPARANPALPPIDLLEPGREGETVTMDNRQRVRLIEEKLAEYGVDARVVEVNQGPTVTQFGIEPGWEVKTRIVKERDAQGRIKYDKDGNPKIRIEEVSRTRVKVRRIKQLEEDLAVALAVPSVRIEAPVPGKPYIGIEVPNVNTTLVTLRQVVETPQFRRLAAKSRLALALGQDVAGEPIVTDLAAMPHLLIAGATGSGKSVCLNSIVCCLLLHNTPEQVRLILVDPKRVELVQYNDVPHLLAPVVVDVGKVIGVLKWVTGEMDNRYRRFAEVGVRNITAYNAWAAREKQPALPYIVLIIDELADMMMLAPDETEKLLCRLAQLARATGIHLVLATQRPSVDVVTGLIKANFPSRISFAVSSQVDSRTILDTVGAEKLLGRGDMLFLPGDAPKPIRLQGCFVSDAEIERLVNWWRANRPPQYVEDLINIKGWSEDEQEDELLDEARALLRQHGRVSVSFLQRKLRIGYNRAARLLEQLGEEEDEDSEG
jgi:DNA segregation ATPase FtsK/SpoIIIE-like protein